MRSKALTVSKDWRRNNDRLVKWVNDVAIADRKWMWLARGGLVHVKRGIHSPVGDNLLWPMCICLYGTELVLNSWNDFDVLYVYLGVSE